MRRVIELLWIRYGVAQRRKLLYISDKADHFTARLQLVIHESIKSTNFRNFQYVLLIIVVRRTISFCSTPSSMPFKALKSILPVGINANGNHPFFVMSGFIRGLWNHHETNAMRADNKMQCVNAKGLIPKSKTDVWCKRVLV